MAVAWFRLFTLTLGQPKIHQHPALCRGIVKEVCGLNVPMYDAVGMDCREGSEEGSEVDSHIRDRHIAEVVAEVMVREVGENSDDLVGRAKGGDQGADGRAIAEVVE